MLSSMTSCCSLMGRHTFLWSGLGITVVGATVQWHHMSCMLLFPALCACAAMCKIEKRRIVYNCQQSWPEPPGAAAQSPVCIKASACNDYVWALCCLVLWQVKVTFRGTAVTSTQSSAPYFIHQKNLHAMRTFRHRAASSLSINTIHQIWSQVGR